MKTVRRFLFQLLFFISSYSYAQQFKLTDSLSYTTVHKNINHSFCQIAMINDHNPFFNNHSDDEGYTLGFYLYTRIKSKSTPDYFDIELKSDLYTRLLRYNSYKIGKRTIYPQYFVEISSLNYHYQLFIKHIRCFLSLGGGIGINNKEKPIWGLPLYIQGGSDGKGGYHGILANNPGEDNIATGGIKPVFFISPSIIKHFSIVSVNEITSKPFLELETGFRIGTKLIGSNIFNITKIDIPVVQFHDKRRVLFILSAILQNKISYCRDGVLIMPEFGGEARISFLTCGFASIFNYGKQSGSIVKYVDNDILMRGYMRVNL